MSVFDGNKPDREDRGSVRFTTWLIKLKVSFLMRFLSEVKIAVSGGETIPYGAIKEWATKKGLLLTTRTITIERTFILGRRWYAYDTNVRHKELFTTLVFSKKA